MNKNNIQSQNEYNTTLSSDAIYTQESAPSAFVYVSEVVPDAILEIRYFSTYNFVGDRIDGYEQPIALLTEKAAKALKAVSDDVKVQGYRLKIFDTYRPQQAVNHFVAWAKKTDDTRMKSYFYPNLDKCVLIPSGYIAEKSGHSRGSTIDLTLFDIATGQEVDMGTPFDWFGQESHPDWCGNPETGEYTGDCPGNTPPADGKINEIQFKNRMILRRAMMRHDFQPIQKEWWHFTLANEPYPNTYFTHPVK